MSADNEDLPSAEERLRALPEPPMVALKEQAVRERRARALAIIASVGMALGAIGAAVALGGRNEFQGRADNNARAAASAAATASAALSQAGAAQSAAEEANRRLRAAGKPTVQIPTITVSQPPLPPVEGLSASQEIAVRSIIAGQLAAYQPSLTPAQVQQIATVAAALVPKPKDGHTPTAAELQPLVVAAQIGFCSNGRCDGKIGPTGPVGPSGAPGANGSPGADAPPVTDEQLKPLIVSALTAYCESQPGGTCKGLTGDIGPRGPQGKFFAGMDCQSDGKWRYYIKDPADGSMETFFTDGPCRIAVLPSEALRTK